MNNKIFEFTINYNQYKSGIYNYCLRKLSNKMLAEDITQSVFLKYYECIDNIKNKNSIRIWLFKTAQNQVYSVFRSKKVHVDKFYALDSSKVSISDSTDIEDNVEQNDIKTIIFRELQLLPEDQRDVYLLKEYGGLNYLEISEICGISKELVKSRLYKVRQKLIDKLKTELSYKN